MDSAFNESALPADSLLVGEGIRALDVRGCIITNHEHRVQSCTQTQVFIDLAQGFLAVLIRCLSRLADGPRIENPSAVGASSERALDHGLEGTLCVPWLLV